VRVSQEAEYLRECSIFCCKNLYHGFSSILYHDVAIQGSQPSVSLKVESMRRVFKVATGLALLMSGRRWD
jgi:hypothetical protein